MVQTKKIRYIIATGAAWLLVWVFTQGIFMSDILTHLPGDLNANYTTATAWILAVALVCFVVMSSYRKRILTRSKLLWLYAIPATLLVFLPSHYSLTLSLLVYVFMILVTVFWQDYLTFGLLQSHLATKVSENAAAIITAFLFILGHIVFFLNDPFDPQLVLIAVAGFIFAFSRRFTGTVYIANVIHLSFYLM